MDTITINCDHCGAPITVGPKTRYVTCAHCGSQLVIHRGEGSIYTEQLEQIEQRTAAIQDKLDRLSLQAELERIDRDWELEREEYVDADTRNHPPRPSSKAAAVGALIAAIIGIIGLAWFAIPSGNQPPLTMTPPPYLDSLTLPEGAIPEDATVYYRLPEIPGRGPVVSSVGSGSASPFLLIPLLGMVIGIIALLMRVMRAATYEKAEQSYQERRQRVLEKLVQLDDGQGKDVGA